VIRTEDREAMRRQVGVVILRCTDGFIFACPWCAFRRGFATEGGAVTRAAERVAQHGKRLSLRPAPVPRQEFSVSSARDAKLRVDATLQILVARNQLDGDRGAFWHATWNHPRAALLAIARAKAHLERARRALAAWEGRRG
jgi:hypothetical protein